MMNKERLKVDWSQPSTIRGAVWVGTAIVAVVALFMDKDPSKVLLIGTAVSGGLGVAISD